MGYYGVLWVLLLEAPSHPINHLCSIGTLKERLWGSIDNREKGRDALDATIAWRIIILVQITIIPDNLRTEIQQGLRIQTLTWAAPTGAKTDHDNRLMRLIFFDQTLEELLAREGCHLVVGHACDYES